MKKKINWGIIRQDYIQGYKKEGQLYYPSMRDLSKKYGKDVAIIGRQAKKDEWVAKRKIFINKKSTRTQQKTIENYSDEASKFDIECFIGARDIIEITKSSIEEFKKKTETLKSQEIKNLKGLTEIRLNSQKEAKLALGEPTDRQVVLHKLVDVDVNNYPKQDEKDSIST
ncbi:hypothetical protein ES708_30825 [subsurface metagenome]